MSRCQVCRHEGEATRHEASEMMYGLGGSYLYRECPDCGTLQLENVPDDLEAHYPADYYSYDRPTPSTLDGLKTWFKGRLGRAQVGGGDLVGSLVLRRAGPSPRLRWLERLGLGLDARILDVGCGHGDLLLEMRREGCRNLTGADPFVDAEIDHGGGLRVLKAGLPDLEGTWDLVMLHHSLEHMPDPAAVFADLARITGPDGRVLIRIPVADSEAWTRYGVHWVQLDAPRHLFLFTRDAIARLAEQAGFKVQSVECDATVFQFWGSEQYLRGIPLRSTRSHASGAGPFSADELAVWAEETKALNASGQGDQAVFYLSKR